MLVETINSRQHLALISLLVSARMRAGLSQTVVAERMGKRQQWIAHFESGQRRIDVVEFIAYCRAVGIKDPCVLLRQVMKVRG